MADLTDELAGLNENARLLLEKYDGVFAQLDEQSKQALLELAGKSEDGLKAIEELSKNGNVAQAENALKLGGRNADELIQKIDWSCRAICSFAGDGTLDTNESLNIYSVTRSEQGTYTITLTVDIGEQFGLAGMANNSDQLFAVDSTGVTDSRSWVKIMSRDNDDDNTLEDLDFGTAILFFGK